ncbi:related to PUS1 - pseudouridine synthase 1 [Ustilago sp. UG-2017a]|nr:related to PUS1 - pseudouridine synthase 1 [Ustilago sp. UG-2017a]
MTERLSQEVAAAAAGGVEEVRPVKRDLESTPAPASADGGATEATPAEKRARFDTNHRETNKHGQKKWERRDRRGTGSTSTTTTSSSVTIDEPSERLPKRKVAVKFGYCGIGYSGLQINPGVKTIEGDMFAAFCNAGAVSADNAVNPNKVGLQRAARTDRGVHAAGNLVSLKLILEPCGLKPGETLVEKVNSILPDFIRIWGITRVQNGFNARQSCDSRMYEYLLPTYVFIPPKPGSSMHDMLVRMQKEELAKLETSDPEASTTSLDPILNHAFWAQHGTSHDFSTDISAKKRYRLPASHLARIRSIFARYLGSHNFHNFTVGKEFRDRSCQRFMKELSISDPKLIQDVEWLSIKFHGQSFMLHQIRKMIGLLVLIGRTGAGQGLVEECFGPARVHIPKAPGLGLLLERPIFDAYNSRIRNSNDKLRKLMRKKNTNIAFAAGQGSDTGQVGTEESRENLSAAYKGKQTGKGTSCTLSDELREEVSYSQHESSMEEFKQTWIYDRIIATEQETNEFGKWLNYLDVFQGPDFEYLNPNGLIPAKAVVKVGEFHRDRLGHRKKDAEGHKVREEREEREEEAEEDEEAYGKKASELEEYEG